MNAKIFNKLIGRSILRIEKVVVVEDSEPYELDDNYLIHTDKGIFQLLIDQDNSDLTELVDTRKIAILGEYEVQEIKFKEIQLEVPKSRIKTFTEVWSKSTDGYLFLVGFFDPDSNLLLGFCLGADELEIILDLPTFWSLIKTYSKNNPVVCISNE